MSSLVLIVMVVIWVTVMNRLKKKGGENASKKNGSSAGGVNRWHSEKLPGSQSARRPVRASDGHILKGVQDITCRQFGHSHPEWEEPSTRYIVHDDPEDGYIILNGKKMRITEADQYENSI